MERVGSTSSSRLTSLDLLRLIAALAVVCFHYLFRGPIAGDINAGYPAAAPFAIYGYLGVSLFFLISGFVITWSAEGRAWQEFTVARIVRLYPGFLVCMTLTFVVLSIANNPRFPTDVSTYAANLSMFARAFGRPSMDGVYWSIMLEIVFYGWVAALMFAGAFQHGKLAIVAIWLAISAGNELFLGNTAIRILLITTYAPFFAFGILAQQIVQNGRSPAAIILLVAAFLLSCQTIRVDEGWMRLHYGTAISYPALFVANGVVFAIFAGALLIRSIVPASKTVLMLGGLTYPLYLLHQYIGYISLNALAPLIGRNAAFVGVLLAVLLTSFLIWRFIETPIRKPLIRGLMSAIGHIAPSRSARANSSVAPT
ncbi:acyltransferase [Mesorhizobium sp. VK25A]|uniref:Acyltransferase n=1 Tax=Mesorhizobium vachelliae TaxID=3072309 RepID=A0ABU5A8Q3_9HYPH|nr:MULTISPECIES: acyltransferase [unclassified Mesorhizobium]MDX8534091.1 acyltransferase [Mesorhizobium sp. VK25D]MDX8548398.1 acyltransferase [Mesorhizobium sp. VK25A]